jgi:hypothetical protein
MHTTAFSFNMINQTENNNNQCLRNYSISESISFLTGLLKVDANWSNESRNSTNFVLCTWSQMATTVEKHSQAHTHTLLETALIPGTDTTATSRLCIQDTDSTGERVGELWGNFELVQDMHLLNNGRKRVSGPSYQKATRILERNSEEELTAHLFGLRWHLCDVRRDVVAPGRCCSLRGSGVVVASEDVE